MSQRGFVRRIIVGIVARRIVARWLAGWLPRADRVVVRWSAGKFSLTSLLLGLPLIWLTTTGARSGQRRTVPLLAIPFGDDLVLVASNFGQSHLPAWYHNLVAQPHAEVSGEKIGRMLVTARETEGAERAELWAAATTVYPGYNAYASYANRPIPVIRLTRQA